MALASKTYREHLKFKKYKLKNRTWIDFSKDTHMASKDMEWCPASISGEMQVKTTMKYHNSSARVSIMVFKRK